MSATELLPVGRRIIRDRAIVRDPWVHLGDDEPAPERGDVIVSLARYRRERAALRARAGRVGARITTEQRAGELVDVLDELPLVAIHIHNFVDGRYFSTARLLRERHGFRGELRACGDVLPDQLFYMQRVGFDAFEVRVDRSLATALRALATFSVRYQGAVDGPPLGRAAPTARAADPAA